MLVHSLEPVCVRLLTNFFSHHRQSERLVELFCAYYTQLPLGMYEQVPELVDTPLKYMEELSRRLQRVCSLINVSARILYCQSSLVYIIYIL